MSDIIIKPGVYDIDIDDYHGQKVFPGPSVSSTSLKTILHQTPAHFWATSDLNPKRFDAKDTKSLSFGRAAHCLVLGEPEFNSKFVISPWENFLPKEARAWRDAQTRQIVKVEEMKTIQAMTAAQKACPDVKRAFTDGSPEKSLVWLDEETQVWCKARPDWLPHKPAERLVTEFKTAETIKPRRLNTAVFDYHYEMQAAMVLDGIQIVMGVMPLGMAHIVQEKDPPYLCEARMFTPEQIDFGRMQNRKALRIFADCLASGKWPGYSDKPLYFETPIWVSRAMEDWDDGNRASTSGNPEGYTAGDYLQAG